MKLIITRRGTDMSVTPQGHKESFRVTSIEGAIKALAKRNMAFIVSAVLKDKFSETELNDLV